MKSVLRIVQFRVRVSSPADESSVHHQETYLRRVLSMRQEFEYSWVSMHPVRSSVATAGCELLHHPEREQIHAI